MPGHYFAVATLMVMVTVVSSCSDDAADTATTETFDFAEGISEIVVEYDPTKASGSELIQDFLSVPGPSGRGFAHVPGIAAVNNNPPQGGVVRIELERGIDDETLDEIERRIAAWGFALEVTSE